MLSRRSALTFALATAAHPAGALAALGPDRTDPPDVGRSHRPERQPQRLAQSQAIRRPINTSLEPYDGPTQPPHDLEVLTLGGPVQRRSSAGTPGRVVVVNLFATWCVGCVQHLDELKALADLKLPWLEVLAISDGETKEDLKEFFASVGETPLSAYDFSILIDTDKTIGRSWARTAIPFSFVLGRDGRAHHRVEGYTEWTRRLVLAQLRKLA